MFVDIFIIGAALIGFYSGFNKGILKTIITTVGTVAAFIAALKFTPVMANVLTSLVPPSALDFVPILAFMLTLVIAILTIRIVGNIVEGVLDSTNLNIINKAAGGLLLAALGVFMLSCIFTFMDKASLLTPRMKETSQIYTHLEPIPKTGFDAIKTGFPIVKDMFNGIFELFDQIQVEKREDK